VTTAVIETPPAAVTGVLFAVLAAIGWAAYIVLSKATGRRFPGSAGLAIAMVVAAFLVTPPAVIAGTARCSRLPSSRPAP
jgi:inner membrane transporter RhtA